jgi:uncharacterized protein (TIGR02246 family)
MSQQTDEQQIRALIAKWMELSRGGDFDARMALIADDVLFLTPGNPPMRRDDFIAATKSMEGKIQIDGHADVKEVTVEGDLATCWIWLEVSVTPLAGGDTMNRAGNVLSVFRRGTDGRWRIWRDANLLAPVA